MRHALIFCAGQGTRWDGVVAKQLAEVDGAPLLARTIGQLDARGIPCRIVCNPEDTNAFGGFGADLFYPKHSQFWCDTALSTEPLWQGQTIGLLGDVWFSDLAMDLFAEIRGLRFVGREHPSALTGGPGEVFGCTWDAQSAPLFKEALTAARDEARMLPADLPTYRLACPWQPYRYLIGADMGNHVCDDYLWCDIDDLTDDFDSVDRYQRWLEAYRNYGGK